MQVLDQKRGIGKDVELAQREVNLKQIDLTGAVRTDKTKEARECKVGGQMFVQIMIGQRVSAEEGQDVFKFTAVSFTLPDLIAGGKEVVEAIIKQNPVIGDMIGNVVSFNDQDSLVMGFSRSSQAVTEQHLQVLPSALGVTRDMVIKDRHGISDENFKDSMKKFNEWQSHSDNILQDAREIHSEHSHGGRKAARNSELFGNSQLWRMEEIFDGKDLYTLAPPHLHYKKMILDDSITDKNADHGDAASIRKMNQYILESYGMDFDSIVIVSANKTATVDRCGANTQYITQYNSSVNAAPVQNNNIQFSTDQPITPYYASDSTSSSNNSTNSSSTSTVAASSSGADASLGVKTQTCSHCGHTYEPPVLCTCMQRIAKLHHH